MKANQPIDDYALAAFICGKLPGKAREVILEALEDEGEARHLLTIVRAALHESPVPDDAMRSISETWKPAA